MTLQERVNYLMMAKYVLNEDYLLDAWLVDGDFLICVKKQIYSY